MPHQGPLGRPRRSLLFAVLLAAACTPDGAPEMETEGPSGRLSTRGTAAIHMERDSFVPDHGEWRMASRDYAHTRFAPFTQINTENVGELQLQWTFTTGHLRGHEAAPLIVDGRMFIVTPFPNDLIALDIADGRLLWRFEPGTDPASQGVACCDVVNRGAAYADGRVVFNTLDNQTIAVDAVSGAEIWRNKLGDINRGESMTMAPLIVRDLVYVGNSGGEFGVRGWITALNLGDGSIAWRAYSTGPDADVLIGDRFRPFYPSDQGRDLGVTSWPPDQWRIGGGTVWGWISYDPERDWIFYGTANPGSWNPAHRPGDNKWTSGIFARDARTGEAVWFYQFVPHDEHDYDAVNENVLVDLPINGEMRQVLLRPERNGFFYVMDRQTGQVLSADPFGPVTWAHSIDLETGRPNKNEEMETGFRQARGVCPAAPGMKDWQPSAWSPRTRLLYMPHNHLCMDYEGVEANYIAGTPYLGANVVMYSAAEDGHRGKFTAWDPVERRIVWQIDELFPVWSGAVVTAGDVVFYGTMDRWFKAVDARTGELLWRFRTGSGVIGQPVTYIGADGRQYVAVLDGVGGWAGAAALGIMPGEDPFIALGFAHAVSDLPQYTGQGGTLYVFALPERRVR
jgi:lanthanide-dependent methanol dehydrogenase